MYQGEELGLPEVWDLPPEVLDDPVWERSGHTVKGRDGCRVPLPWTPDGPSFGFGSSEPWLPQPAAFAELAASVQDGVVGSTLELYRSALRLRSAELVGVGALAWLDLRDDVLAFRRGDIACVINYGADPLDLPAGEVLVHTGSGSTSLAHELHADEAAWVRLST